MNTKTPMRKDACRSLPSGFWNPDTSLALFVGILDVGSTIAALSVSYELIRKSPQ
jgi:hypothetical protein